MQLYIWLIFKMCGKIYKETKKTRRMPPIKLSHGLKCWNKHPHLPTIQKWGPFGWEQEKRSLGIKTLRETPCWSSKGHYWNSSLLKLHMLSKLQFTTGTTIPTMLKAHHQNHNTCKTQSSQTVQSSKQTFLHKLLSL
jgi:hypothetical protein